MAGRRGKPTILSECTPRLIPSGPHRFRTYDPQSYAAMEGLTADSGFSSTMPKRTLRVEREDRLPHARFGLSVDPCG